MGLFNHFLSGWVEFCLFEWMCQNFIMYTVERFVIETIRWGLIWYLFLFKWFRRLLCARNSNIMWYNIEVHTWAGPVRVAGAVHPGGPDGSVRVVGNRRVDLGRRGSFIVGSGQSRMRLEAGGSLSKLRSEDVVNGEGECGRCGLRWRVLACQQLDPVEGGRAALCLQCHLSR